MPVNRTAVAEGPFTGNGTTTAFPISTMHVLSAEEIEVKADDVLVSASLYSVALGEDGSATINFTTAPAVGVEVMVYQNPLFTQPVNFLDQGPFLASSHNEGLDRDTVRDQVLADGVARSVRVAPGTDQLDPVTPESGKYLAWTSDGQIVNSSGTGADAGLRTDLAASGGSALVGFTRTGGTARSLQSKARDHFDLRDFGVVNRFATSNEYTAEIQAALNQAKAEGITAVYCEESYRVTGTLVQPASVGIVSSGGVSRWFEGSPADESAGPGFYKPSDGLNGSLLIRGVGAHLIGISLDHQKVDGATPFFGGVMQMGPGSSSSNFNNTLTMNCHLRGHEINESTGLRRGTVNFDGPFGVAGTDCTLVHWPASSLGFQRYWHIFTNIYLENARRGFNMGDQSNANFISGFRFRGVYRPVWMTGGGFECIENVFDGVWSQNYSLPTPTQTGGDVAALPENDLNIAQADIALITMEDACRFNVFKGPTEGGGRLWYLSAPSAAAYNDASGLINNERFQAPMPSGWALPKNEFDAGRRSLGGKREKFIPLDQGATDGHVQGHGARIEVDHVGTTGLPLLNGAVGAPTTGAASRIMAKWTLPETISKAAAPHIRLTSRFVVHAAGGGAGSHSTEIEWEYRVSDNYSMAGALEVISVRQSPASDNYVVGLHFISGETGTPRPFALAVTLGNLGAVAPSQVSQSHIGKLEGTNATPRPMAEFGDIDFTPTALTSDDVTDAVSMLAVAVTAI